MKTLSRNHLCSSGQGKAVKMEMMVGNSFSFSVWRLWLVLYGIHPLLSMPVRLFWACLSFCNLGFNRLTKFCGCHVY
jgi:hypothetical protein